MTLLRTCKPEEAAMSVMRFDPFGDPFRSLDRLTSQLLSGARTPMAMPMDVWQSEDGYHVALDLPGVDPGSVEITSERNVLTIRAERRPGYGENDRVLVAERPHGQYTRQLQVGDALDSGNVAATYHNGVLHLTIPISPAAQPRRIEVRQGGEEQPVPVGAEPAGAGRSAESGATAGARG
jgi:HSP20 family protein